MENQLKEKELRIGNHIEFDSKIFTVKEIRDKSITVIGRNGYSQLSIIYVNPIPLTEDILVKLGFEKTANPRELKYGDYSILLLNEIRFVIYNYMENPPSVKVSTVHQLQNLFFSLCGEELTFKN